MSTPKPLESSRMLRKIASNSIHPLETLTKHGLISDVAKTFDALGWFSLYHQNQILMQKVWELKVDWDDPVPGDIHCAWLQWRTELHLLSQMKIPCCYFDKQSQILYQNPWAF